MSTPSSPQSDPNTASAVQNYANLYINPIKQAYQQYQTDKNANNYHAMQNDLIALRQALYNADAGMRSSNGTSLLSVLVADEANPGAYPAMDLPDTVSKCGSLLYHMFEAIKDINYAIKAGQPTSADLGKQLDAIFNQFNPNYKGFSIINNAPTAAQTISAGLTDPGVDSDPNDPLSLTSSWLGGFLINGTTYTPSGGSPVVIPGIFKSLQTVIADLQATPSSANYSADLKTLQAALTDAISQVNCSINECIERGGVDINNGECLAQLSTLLSQISNAKNIVDVAIYQNTTLDLPAVINAIGSDNTGAPLYDPTQSPPYVPGSIWGHYQEFLVSLNILPTPPTPPSTTGTSKV